MSTGYGEFLSRDNQRVYADASQMGQRISLCRTHDGDVYFDMNEIQACQLMMAMRSAFEHNGWELPW
jgi:hypothetical protein